MDRNHTYKILDYYDEYKENNPNAFIELMVIANRIPHERRRRLDAHGISWKEIPESEFTDIMVPDMELDKYNINLTNNSEVKSKSKVAGGYGSERRGNKTKIIPEIYDNIGSVLRDMLAERGPATMFTTDELYPLYVQQYPEDEEFMEKRGRDMPLKKYLPGMVSDYSKYAADGSRDRPAIQRLAPRTYRFV